MTCFTGLNKWLFMVSMIFMLAGLGMLFFPEQNNLSFAPTSGPQGQPGNTLIRVHGATEVCFSGLVLILVGGALLYIARPRNN